MSHSVLVTCNIFVLTHKDGTNHIKSGSIFKIEKILSEEELKNELFIEIGSYPYRIRINNALPCLDSNVEQRAVAHPIVMLISDGCAPDEKEMEEFFNRLKNCVEPDGWVASKSIIE